MFDHLFEQVGMPLVVTAVVFLFSYFMNSKAQTALLGQNIKTTELLAEAVNELRLQLGIFGERYVTRDELDRKLREYYNGA